MSSLVWERVSPNLLILCHPRPLDPIWTFLYANTHRASRTRGLVYPPRLLARPLLRLLCPRVLANEAGVTHRAKECSHSHVTHTVLFRPTLRSRVTIAFEVKTFGSCPMSHIILKSVTFGPNIEIFRGCAALEINSISNGVNNAGPGQQLQIQGSSSRTW